MQAAELLVLALLVAGLYALLTPVRRLLEAWIARVLLRRKPPRRGDVVVLGRRPDGTFGRQGDDRER
jgi:hypothetical protein